MWTGTSEIFRTLVCNIIHKVVNKNSCKCCKVLARIQKNKKNGLIKLTYLIDYFKESLGMYIELLNCSYACIAHCVEIQYHQFTPWFEISWYCWILAFVEIWNWHTSSQLVSLFNNINSLTLKSSQPVTFCKVCSV